jgi:autotransporter-associated beta strand protein
MKLRNSRAFPIVRWLLLTQLCSNSLQAGNTWDGGGADSLWSNALNWSSDTLPGYGTLVFAGDTRTTNTIDWAFNMNQVQWTGSSDWTLNDGGGFLMLFDNAGVQAKLENYSTGLVTINAPISFAASAGANFGEINAVNGDMLFSGGTLGVTGSAVNGIKLWGGAGRDLTFANTVNAAGKWFGMTSVSAQNVTIASGANVTTGDWYVMNGGTLNLAGGTLNTSAIRLGGDFGATGNQNQALSGTLALTPAGGGIGFGGIINTVAGNTSGALMIDSLNSAGTNTLTGGIFLDSDLRIRQAGGGGLVTSTGSFDLKNQLLTVETGAAGIVTISQGLTSSTGGGALNKIGAGTLVLAGGGSYAGATTLTNGTLEVQGNNALGTAAGGTSVAFGSVLRLNAVNYTTAESLDLRGQFINLGTSTWAGDVTVNTSSEIRTGDSLTLTGALVMGDAATSTIEGGGILNLAGGASGLPNSRLQLMGSPATTLLISGASSFGGEIQLSGFNTLRLGANEVFSGPTHPVVGMIGGGRLDLAGQSVTLRSIYGAGGAVTNSLAGSHSVLKFVGSWINSGILELTSDGNGTIEVVRGAGGALAMAFNSYSGLTTIEAGGTIEAERNNALGSAASGTVVQAGGALSLGSAGIPNVDYTTAEAVTIHGDGIGGSGAFYANGTSSFAGQITTASDATIKSGGVLTLTGGLVKDGTTLTLGGSGVFHIDAVGISGASAGSDLVIDGATVNLNTSNRYNGPTTVQNGGVLRLGTSNVLPSAPNPYTALSLVSGGSLDMNGYSDTVASLSGSGTVTNGSAGGSSTLTVGGSDGSGSFSGVIEDGAAVVALVKTGTGTQTLSGANTYSGATSIQQGTLTMGASGTLPSATAVNIASFATLDLAGYDQTVASLSGSGLVTNSAVGGLSVLTTGDANTSSFFGLIEDGNAIVQLVKSGSGAMLLGGSQGYTGGTLVSGGTLLLGNSNVLISDSDLDVAVGGQFNLNGHDQSLGAMTGGGGIVLGTGNLTAGGDNSDSTFGGAISGSGTLTKTGSGVLTLSGTSSYTGLTTIQDGVLRLGGSERITTDVFISTGAVFDLNGFDETIFTLEGDGDVLLGSGTLTFAGMTGSVFSGDISGSGGLIKTSEGRWVFTGDASHTGGTTIAEGILQVGDFGTTGTLAGDVEVQGGATLAFARSNGLDFSGVISGSGGVSNNGQLTLSGVNSYSGATTLFGGTLSITHGDSLGSFTPAPQTRLFFVQDATLRAAAAATVFDSYGVQIDAGVTATFDGADHPLSVQGSIVGDGHLTTHGDVTLVGANSYVGDTTVASGVLSIGEGGNGGTLGTGDVMIEAGAELKFNRSNTYNNNNDISGAGNLRQSGGGTTGLSGINTYTGTTFVDAGTLSVLADNALGSSMGGTQVGGLGTLLLSGVNYTAAEPLMLTGTLSNSGTSSFAGTITSNAGRIAPGGGSLTLTGGIVLDSSQMLFQGAGTVHLTGNGFSTSEPDLGILIDGPTLVLGAASSFTGAVFLENGAILRLADVDALPQVELHLTDGDLDLNGFSTTVSLLAGSDFSVIHNGAVGASTLTIDGIAFSSFAGLINDGVGTVSLAHDGTGNLFLGGSNTYSGTTTISGGRISIDADGALGSAAVGTTVAAGAALELSNVSYTGAEEVTIHGDGISGSGAFHGAGSFAGVIIAASDASIKTDGTLTLTGGLVKDGTTLTLGGSGVFNISSVGIFGSSPGSDLVIDGSTVNLHVASSYSGLTTVQNGGTLNALNPSGPVGSATGLSSVVIEAGSTLAGNGTIAPAAGGSVTLNGDFRIQATPPSQSTFSISTSSGGSFDVGITGVLFFDLFAGAGDGDNTGSVSASDRLLLGGNASFAQGSQLVIGNPNAMTGWAIGDSWLLWDVTNAGTIMGSLLIDAPSIDGIGFWDFDESTGVLSISAIPEPSSALVGVLLAMGLFVRRRAAHS